VIRPLRGLEEQRACVALQEEVWGVGFSERVPPAVLKVAARIGGVSAGAFDEAGRLVGFVFGLAGYEEGRPVHWSHMLAVHPGWRRTGIGRRLKLHQRDVLLARGVERCYWTFDPLEGRNGWLNLARLGVTVGEYVPEMYGRTDSPVHSGVGTDRFIALWDMASDRVSDRLEGRGSLPDRALWDELPRAFEVTDDGDGPLPVEPVRVPSEASFLVPAPLDLESLLDRDPEGARRWRAATRAVLGVALDGGYEVRELIRLSESVGAYLVERT
jgi:predicted GNAT superfamily acetyltransferase